MASSLLRLSVFLSAIVLAAVDAVYVEEDGMDACDNPTAVTSNVPVSVNISKDKWNFFNINVNETVKMHSLRYRLSVNATDAGNASDVQVAFLVGRCLSEAVDGVDVDGGRCPPRCSILTAAERVPQYCTIPEYCPGCQAVDSDACTNEWVATDDIDQQVLDYEGFPEIEDDATLSFGTPPADSYHYVDRWVNLKLEEEKEADFYFGIYGMQVPGTSMEVEFWVTADDYSTASAPAIGLIVMLCAAFMFML